jgi:hypothetical protein
MTPATIDALIDAAAATVGIEVAPTSREPVRRYLRLAGTMADTVFAHGLTARDETGAVFVPVGPDTDPGDR